MSKNTEIAPKDRLRGLMSGMRTQIAETLPKHLDVDTMTRIVLVEGTRNPDLRLCTPESLAGSIMLASQLGLLCSSPLGHFYLVPRRVKIDPRRRNSPKRWECGFVIGYKGYAELARRAGLRLNAGCVYNDEIAAGLFEWTNEPPTMNHRGGVGIARNDDELSLAYCVAVDERRGRAGHRWQLVLEREILDEARRQAQTDRIWRAHYASMARKTAVRRLLANGLVPLSSELERALQREREQELEALEVLDADDIPEIVEPRDPLRQVLELDDTPEAEPDQVEDLEDPPDRPIAEIVERALELEGLLEAEQIHGSIKASGLKIDPDGQLEDADPKQLAAYLRELEERSK